MSTTIYSCNKIIAQWVKISYFYDDNNDAIIVLKECLVGVRTGYCGCGSACVHHQKGAHCGTTYLSCTLAHNHNFTFGYTF